MRRRCHIEFVSHTEIKVTNFAHQKTFVISAFKPGEGIDLITLKKTKPDEYPIFELSRSYGSGKLGDPLRLAVIAETEAGTRTTVASFDIYGGQQTIEVDFPETKAKKR